MWPDFLRNTSEQFEARLVNVEITDSSSLILKDMQGSVLPVAVAHGEGRVDNQDSIVEKLENSKLISMRYVNSDGESTEQYPLNPNGSPNGITALSNEDGRFSSRISWWGGNRWICGRACRDPEMDRPSNSPRIVSESSGTPSIKYSQSQQSRCGLDAATRDAIELRKPDVDSFFARRFIVRLTTARRSSKLWPVPLLRYG